MRTLVAWGPVVVWAALIFAFSATPNLRFVDDAGVDFVVRKLGHMTAFGILALLAWRALAMMTSLRRPWLAALVLAVVYAAIDEVHQAFVAGRHASPADVAIDGLGALLAVVLASTVLRVHRYWARREGMSPPNG